MRTPVSQEAYLAEFKTITDSMYALTQAKNSDYAGGEDAFRNFTMVEELTMGTITTEQGMFTRIIDKIMRVSTFIRKGTLQVADEKVEDTLLDLAVYAIIFVCYRRAQRKNEDK